jgi:hypothetical protein
LLVGYFVNDAAGLITLEFITFVVIDVVDYYFDITAFLTGSYYVDFYGCIVIVFDVGTNILITPFPKYQVPLKFNE